MCLDGKIARFDVPCQYEKFSVVPLCLVWCLGRAKLSIMSGTSGRTRSCNWNLSAKIPEIRVFRAQSAIFDPKIVALRNSDCPAARPLVPQNGIFDTKIEPLSPISTPQTETFYRHFNSLTWPDHRPHTNVKRRLDPFTLEVWRTQESKRSTCNHT